MSSVMTNSSAMVALETLRGINKNLGNVQSQISTGKTVSTARDNAAIWAISTVMSTDVSSFDQISNSLNLGSATVGVARSAAENITDNLKDLKELIVSAQEENVDRSKIQTDIDQIVKQIGSVVEGAQFNGQNLLNSGGSISILSSLDRASDGTVTASKIDVNRQNLSTDALVVGADALDAGDGGGVTFSGASIAAAATGTVTIGEGTVVAGTTSSFDFEGASYTYTSNSGDSASDIATALGQQIDDAGITDVTVSVTDNVISITNGSAAAMSLANAASTKGGSTAGLLNGLDTLNVETNEDAADALTAIEGYLQSSIDAAASFGSSQKRIEYQVGFVSSLTDSLKTGIGALTDADMEEASARLQSLQVQQQLGVQALSIANQAPQQLLALFR